LNISAHLGLNVKTIAENFSSSFGFRHPSIINSLLIFQNVVTSGFTKRADVSNVIVSFDAKQKTIN
jgi:hypothetical protein